MSVVTQEANQDERWRPVPDYEGWYEVSDLGRVRSVDRQIVLSTGWVRKLSGKVLRPGLIKDRARVVLCNSSGQRTFLLHRLVATAFHGPGSESEEVCHNNGNPLDNCAANLRWDTSSANKFDTVRHGHHPNAIKTHCKRGHEFTAENTYLYNGTRNCRTCREMRRKAYRDREARVAEGR